MIFGIAHNVDSVADIQIYCYNMKAATDNM